MTLFRVAAIWNVLGGFFGLVMPATFLKMMYRYEGPITAPLFSMQAIVWLLVIVFGIGYWMVSRDFQSNRGIVVLGVICKTAVGIYWLGEVTLGVATPMIVGGAIGDLVFAALFVRALRAQPALALK